MRGDQSAPLTPLGIATRLSQRCVGGQVSWLTRGMASWRAFPPSLDASPSSGLASPQPPGRRSFSAAGWIIVLLLYLAPVARGQILPRDPNIVRIGLTVSS